MGYEQETRGSLMGKVKSAYLRFVVGDYIANPATMVRRSFIDQYNIRYLDDYIYAEDFKFWVDIAKKGGQFYFIPECLTHYRWHKEQVSQIHREEQADIAHKIQNEILNDLLDEKQSNNKNLEGLFNDLAGFNELGLLSSHTIFRIAYELFENMSRL